MNIRVESFRGYFEPATCEELRNCVDEMLGDLMKDFPKDQSKWWLTIYVLDGKDKLMLCQTYWQNGHAIDIVMI